MRYLNATATSVWFMAVASLIGGCGGGGSSVFGQGNSGTGTLTGTGTGTAAGTGTGTAGSGGVIVPTTGTGSGAGTTTGGALGDAACVSNAIRGDQRPATLYFMMDNSQSMTTVDPGQTLSRWEIISAAVPAFAADPANAGLFAGLDFFPAPGAGGGGRNGGGAVCLPSAYENQKGANDVLAGTGKLSAYDLGRSA